VIISARNGVRENKVFVVIVHEFTASCTASCELSRINSPTIALKEPALKVVKVQLIVRDGLTIFTAVV